jgi:hypothetical protein
MREALTPIAGIPGVIGTALLSADDRCLTSALMPPYEEMLIERVMRGLRHALVTLNVTLDSEQTWSGLYLRCDGGHLLVRRIGEMVMLVFGQPTMNVAMVNVGLNVAAMKLRVGEGSGVVPTPPRPAAPAGSGPIPRTSSQRIPMPVRSAASGPVMGWSAASTTAAGVVPRTTLDVVLRALAKQIGASAQTVMLDELVALGLAPNNVPFASYTTMIDRLAQHVGEPGRRTAIVIEAELAGIHTATQ